MGCVVDLCLQCRAIDERQAIEYLKVCQGMTEANARISVANITLGPLYQLGYVLGDREIRRLEQDMKTRQGEGYRATEFYQQLLRMGRTPVQRVRKELLGE